MGSISRVVTRTAMKFHDVQPSAILPSSLQQWNLSQNFTPAVSSGFLLLPASHDGSGLTFLVHRAEADSLPSRVAMTDSFP